MKRLHIAGAAIGALIAVLIAGDVANAGAVPAYSWTGFYIGAGTGIRQSKSNATINTIDEIYAGNFVQHDLPACTLNSPPCATGASFDGTAFRVGPYVGYNFQFAPLWVAGIEGDWGWANNTVTQNAFKYFQAVPGFLPDSSIAVKSGWDASLRGRVGFLAMPNLLVYATGGVAWLNVEVTSDCGPNSCLPGFVTPEVISHSTIWTGWTVGAGVESMFAPNWILRGEYRYTDYGTKSFFEARPCSPTPSASCGTATSINVGYDLSMKTHAATLGIAYKFGGP